jgi:hypothetical protein
MRRFGKWLIAGEGSRIVYGYKWEWTPEWLFHGLGNGMLLFYTAAIAFCVYLACH